MRLIDADALLTAIIEYPYGYRGMIESEIENQPTVDAVSVIRCKDCIHNQLPPTCGNANCELWYGMTDLYGYCSRAERKEE